MTLHRRTLLQSAAASALATLATAAVSQATPVSLPAPAVPPEVARGLPGGQRLGSTRMRVFGFSVYDATLWVEPGFAAESFEKHPLALTLTYLRDLKSLAIAERSLVEMGRSAALSPAQSQAWLAAMQASFPDVRSGDRLTGLHHPTRGAEFWLNGLARPGVPDAEFSRLFFGIWLSAATSEPEMRRALLARPSA
jgi:hypothetical protein